MINLRGKATCMKVPLPSLFTRARSLSLSLPLPFLDHHGAAGGYCTVASATSKNTIERGEGRQNVQREMTSHDAQQ